MLLSVIVPIYNVEQYIRPCIESVFKQDLNENDFELILVNDGTKDRSIEMIEDIILQHDNISVIDQENQGLSAARNIGLSKASGQYVLFLDSDDLLIDNTLSKLLSLTNDQIVDLLIAGFVKKNNEEINKFENSNSTDFIIEHKTAFDYFLNDFNPEQCYVWRTIYRKAFLDEHELRFIPGIYFEDVPFTTECILKAKHCIRTSLVFYIYRQREDSIVSSINLKKILDFNTVFARLWEMYTTYSLPVVIKKQLMNTIFKSFSVSMWYVSHNQQLLEKKDVIISDLKQKIPELSFTNGFKQRIISLLIHNSPSTYLKLRALK